MDYVDSLRFFRAVVEAGGFRRAADMMSVSTPIVSRAVAALEHRLGARLFHRTTRQVSMTETAERYYARACRILDEVDALDADTRTDSLEATGVLRLVAHTTATMNGFLPLLASFARAHPKIQLDVTLSERPVDLVADGYDLGIVVPYMLTSDMTVTRLLERVPEVIVASPQYLGEHCEPQTPGDLSAHKFVMMSSSIRRPTLAFREGEEEITIPLDGDITSNSPMFNRAMILEGFGLGVVPQAVIQKELATGALTAVLQGFPLVDATVEIRLAYSTRSLMPAKVRVFIEHAVAFYESSLPMLGS